MANFLELNSINVPVENDEWDAEPEYTDDPADELHDGGVVDGERFERGMWSGKTTILSPSDIKAFVGLIEGRFDVFNYETSFYMTSEAGAVPRGGTRSTSAPKVGAANFSVASGATAVLPAGLAGSDDYGLVTYKKDASGEYTSWTHVGYRSTDGEVYEDGVDGGAEVGTNWHAKSGGDIQLLGKNDAGTNAVAEYDNTVILRFAPNDEMLAAWTAADYEWESAPTFLKMTGDGIKYRQPENYVVRGTVVGIEYQKAVVDGVFYNNAGRVVFELREYSRSYVSNEVFLAGSSAGQSAQASDLTVATASVTAPTYYWTFDDADLDAPNRYRALFGQAPATVINATTGAAGKIGEAVSFDGTGSTWVEFPTQPMSLNNESWSVSLWFKPDNVADTSRRIFQTRGVGGAGSKPGVIIYHHQDDIRVLVENTSTTNTGVVTAGTAVLSTGVWAHIVLTYDNATGDLSAYIDGSNTWNDTTTFAGGDNFTPSTNNGATLGLSREGATLSDKVNGDVCEVGIWRGHELTSGEVSTIYTNQNGGTRGFTPTFSPASPPGAPYADYNAQGLSAGNVTTWTNAGSDATGDVTTFGTSNAPECVDDGSGPAPGAKYVRFDSGNSEALQGSFTTLRSTGNVFAMVARVNTGAPPGAFYWFDGDGASNRHAMLYQGTEYDLFAGSQPGSGAQIELQKWVRIVGRFGSAGKLVVERATRIDATTGTGSQSGMTLGARYSEANYGPVSIARLVFWDDGTTLLEAEQWLEAEYPFEAVPPGNPTHVLNPNDYFTSTATPNLADQGSGTRTWTPTDMEVGYDTDCPEQKVWKFNNSTSRIQSSGSVANTTNSLWSVPVRSTIDSQQDPMFGDSAPAWYCRYLTTNVVQRFTGGTAYATVDMDTTAPFNTRLRWANIQFLIATAGATYIDGTSYDSGDSLTGMNVAGVDIGFQGTNYFAGNMGTILMYNNNNNEANAARAAEVEEWLQRHYRLCTLPGSPFVDTTMTTDNVTTSGSLVDTLTNDGTESDFTQTGTNRPTFVTTDGPEPGVGVLAPGFPLESIGFDNQSGTKHYLDTSSTFTAKTQPITSLSVYRVTVSPVNGLSFGSSDTGTTNCVSYLSLSTDFDQIDGGIALSTSVAVVGDEWRWQAGEFNGASSHVSTSAGDSASGDAGTETHGTKHRIGQFASLGANGAHRMHRHIYWDDGTTWEEAEEYARRRYPNVDPY